MRTLSFCLSTLALVTTVLQAQTPQRQDPFLGGYILGNSAEISYMHTKPSGATVIRWLWDCDTTSGALNSGDSLSYPDSSGIGSGRYMDITTGDFNADGKDEIVAVWAGTDGILRIGVEEPKKSTGGIWDLSNRRVSRSATDAVSSNLRVVTGNFDLDPNAEVLVAYWSSLGSIQLVLYDINNQLEPQRVSSIADVPYSEGLGGYAQFDVATGDFDRDGVDEILLVRTVGPQGTWTSVNIRLKVYDYYSPTSTIIPGADVLVNLNRASLPNTKWRDDFVLSCGDYDNDGDDEALLLYQEGYMPDILIVSEVDLLLLPIAVSRTLDGFNCSITSAMLCESWRASEDVPPGGGTSISSGDVDMDGAAEVVLAGMTRLSIWKCGLWPAFAQKAYTAFNTRSGEGSRRLIKLADLDATASRSSWTPEVVVADFATSHWKSATAVNPRVRTLGITIDTLAVPPQITGFTILGERILPTADVSRFAVTAGDFDGDAIRLRNPRLITKEKFVQPLVIMNVPPTHYDILDGVTYDVCKQYPSNTSFKATYLKQSSSTQEFSTQQTKDWSLSSSIEGKFKDILGLKFSASYGESFSKKTDSSNTLMISDQVYTSGDDYLFTSVSEYEFWEYPLFAGGYSLGSVLVTIPRLSKLEWLPSKNPDAFHFEPSHEVGNVLSYMTEPSLLGNFDIESMICKDFQGYVISEKAGKSWEVFLSQSQGTEEEWTKSVGLEVGGSLSAWGIELGVEGKYSKKDVTTHKSKATRDVKVTLEVSEPDASLGNADYKVTPLVYWSTTGALVVDYATQPTVWSTPDTSLRTWWQRHYEARPDPAFILPWRYDVEKTHDTVSAPALRNLTRSLRLSPSVAAEGDTVRIGVRVHNFSLKATPTPVTVRFYVGDPDSGGVPIVGLGGVTELTTPGVLPPRETSQLIMYWAVSGTDLKESTRIYALLDPDHSMEEIHEENNKGWTILSLPSVTGIDRQEPGVRAVQYELLQNYPNPFNPNTIIPFRLPAQSDVVLKVYDILGRELATLIQERLSAGLHYAHFSGSQYASGVYFYRLQAGNFTAVKKFLLLR